MANSEVCKEQDDATRLWGDIRKWQQDRIGGYQGDAPDPVSMIRAALKHARHDALEEAEGICESRITGGRNALFEQEAGECADAIRRLKEEK